MDDAAATDDDLEPALVAWILEVTGGRQLRAERRQGGASRAGYAVDVEHHDNTIEALWLRLDTGYGPQSSTLYTVRREGAVYGALGDSPVRVARLRAVHPTRDAFLAERLVGRNWFAEIHDADEQERTARAFMQQLAALHAIDVHQLTLPELGPVRRVSEHVREELAIWEQQYTDGGADEPVISLALSWLDANVPADADWPVVLVQGDTGPGNFMYADGEVVAVMDWEMAHWGDLHDDFGWICVRDVQERFTSLPDRFADYVHFGGRALDLDRLRYFRVLAQARCAIGTRRGLLARDSRGEIANHLIYSTLHLRLLADALAEAMALPPFDLDQYLAAASDAPSDTTWLFDVALADLRDVVVPALPKGFAQQRAKGLARLTKFLRSHDRLGSVTAAEERIDLGALLEREVIDLAGARRDLCAQLAAGTVDHRAATAYCRRQAARVTLIARDAMGALATRRYAPID